MSRKNREYKKGKPYKDYRKFIIVAEGEREDDYFSYFKKITLRVDVEIVQRQGGRSAAKYLIDRITEYDYRYGIEPEDQVWFVLDVDRWPRKEIHDLYQNCEVEPNWHIAISNICFEVWLHFHFIKQIPAQINTGRRLKANLVNIVPGGYNRNAFAKLIEIAAVNARNADEHKEHYFPTPNVTKVYRLAEMLLSFLGNNWKKEIK